MQDLTTGAIEITSQNHNFAVDHRLASAGVADLTHVNLNDGVCEGLARPRRHAFSVQYHPEAGPGPHDSRYLFARFADRMIGSATGRWRRRPGDAGAEPVGLPEPARGGADAAGATDIHSILIIGSGPIVIGQACEFDYSGTQACRVLREEGYRVILANSNPATIMTDPDFADRDLHRAADARGRGPDHRARAARRRAADARRPDRAQHRDGAATSGA